MRVALNQDACDAGTVGIKERVGRLSGKLENLAVLISLIKLIALVEKGEDGVAVRFDVLAGQGVELRRGELNRWWVEWNEDALGER